MSVYSPRKAWLRASVFFAVCIAIAAFAGTFSTLLPVVAPGQASDPYWLLATAVVTSYMAFAYFWIWPQGTVTLGRQLHPGFALLFGLFWGGCQGLLMLTVFRFVASFELGVILNVVIMFVVYSAFSGAWQSQYWDIYVSPEHNIPEWNVRKVAIAHTPFLLLALIHLALFDNGFIFVAWQAIAMMASAWNMHFPSPFDPDTQAESL